MAGSNGIPRHIAIIMDGNGRWAESRGEERLFGHNAGVKSLWGILEGCVKQGVRYLTLYVFSTENWGRPQNEVKGLMEIFCRYAAQETPELKKNGVRLSFIGDLEGLGSDVKEAISYCRTETSCNDRLNVVVAINYSSRWEITEAVKSIASKVLEGKIGVDRITQDTVSENLETKNIPDPDLLIRTSGECRISNFLLWQIAYSELYFTDVLWPDFGEEQLAEAISEYQRRNRRFGLI